MPMKRDGSGRRWVEMEFAVPGSPEQVWQAIATGAGMGAWFTPATIDEYVGGAIEFDFGGGNTSGGPVIAWEPPVRFAYEEVGWNGEAPPVATEVTVTSRCGDECVVRMVHSLSTEKDDWDHELESFEGGWPSFFEILRIYLADYAGQPAAILSANANPAGGEADAWRTVLRRLDLVGANRGDPAVSPEGAPRLAGTVEQIQQNRRFRQVLLRVSEPGPGVAAIGTCTVAGQVMVNISVYVYGGRSADIVAAEQPGWTHWLSKVFAGS
jgi:uncharacterized protein YndB with AHSA1/START domain